MEHFTETFNLLTFKTMHLIIKFLHKQLSQVYPQLHPIDLKSIIFLQMLPQKF